MNGSNLVVRTCSKFSGSLRCLQNLKNRISITKTKYYLKIKSSKELAGTLASISANCYFIILKNKFWPSGTHSIRNMKAAPTSPSTPLPSLVALPVSGAIVLHEVGATDPVGELEVAFAVLFNVLQISGTNVANATFSVSFPPNRVLHSRHTLKFTSSTSRRVLETWHEDSLDLVNSCTVAGVICCSAADGRNFCAITFILRAFRF